ncbi:MAG: protein TolA [Gammaproteobacteria bacterium]|nr:MAG: protein TolA [Gammaproteobacteria bacterium]
MSSSGLFTELKQHPWILALVLIAHIVVALLLGLNLVSDDNTPMPKVQKHNIINAVAVDAKKYDEQKKKQQQVVKKKVEEKKTAEKKKQLALKKQQEAEKKAKEKKALEKKHKQEVKKKELALAKKKEADRLKKEKLAKAEIVKAKAKKEKERKQREKIAAEKKRKIEEDRQRRAEEKAEFERALLEEERHEEEARKQAVRAARLHTQREQYVLHIAQKVEKNWLRPVSTISGQSCDVIVTQTMSGDVIDVRVQSCASDNAFQRSVERAVRKASPLPLPPDPELFDREIYFKFKPHI